MRDDEQELAALRDRIRSLDEELLALAAERVHLAREIGEIKRRQRQPTIDYGQERRVLERAVRTAGRVKLDPAVAEELLAKLIQASVSVQEEESLREAGTGAGRTAVVVGGMGRMGRWMGRFLEAQGYAVAVADPKAPGKESERAEALVSSADLVVCATPPGRTVERYRSMYGAVPTGVVVDLASIKTPLLEPIRELQRAGGRVASIHPMFGPSTYLLRDADVVVCDTGDEEATAVVESLFAPTSARLVRIPLVAHDQIMADLLSLAHATAIAFALSVPQDEHPVRSTTFRLLEDLAATAVRESPEVYYEIQANNPASLAAVERLRASVEQLITVVRARSPRDFEALMEEGRRRTRVSRRRRTRRR